MDGNLGKCAIDEVRLCAAFENPDLRFGAGRAIGGLTAGQHGVSD